MRVLHRQSFDHRATRADCSRISVVKSGFTFGETEKDGHEAISGRIHTHDLHATMLNLLGLDHKHLTYRYAGRDFRLTDVAGNIVKEILA